MRIAVVALVLLVALLLAGLPGLVGVAPRIENEPWGVTTYDFRYSVDVGNFGTASARNMTVRFALLRDFAPFQMVETQTVDAPGMTMEVDELGNRFATFELAELPAGSSFVANTTVRVKIYSIDFSVGSGTFTGATPDPQFVAPEPYVESSDFRIVNRSARLWENSTGFADYSYRAYAWTAHHMTYETQPQERGAVWGLRTGRGMCYEYANLYMALMRAQGLAAKRVNGWGERFQRGEVHRAEEIAHAWALVYTADHGWIPVDPTFGDVHEYENYLKVNDMHVILTEGVNRHFYRVTYERAAGTNVQVDYVVQTLAKIEENLSTAREIVLIGISSVPLFATAVIVAQVVLERRRRGRRADQPPPPPGI